jgi:hypothetical protein
MMNRQRLNRAHKALFDIEGKQGIVQMRIQKCTLKSEDGEYFANRRTILFKQIDEDFGFNVSLTDKMYLRSCRTGVAKVFNLIWNNKRRTHMVFYNDFYKIKVIVMTFW